MIICPDQSKLESAINIIKKWSADNSMILNNNKSGIIEFRPRRSKPSKNFQIGKQNPNICGIPIVSQYRYLGLMLNPTLHLNQQINIVFKKAQQIYSRICPFLFSADADTRKNLWQIFILPQIEFLLPLLANENTQYLRKKVNQVIFGSFKLFMGLSKNTPNRITQLLLGYDFIQRAYYIQTMSRCRWEVRRSLNPTLLLNKAIKMRKEHNALSKTPQELIYYINLCNSFCSKCKCINSVSHLRKFHAYCGPDIEELLSLINSVRGEHKTRDLCIKSLKGTLLQLIKSLKYSLISTSSL